MRTVGILLLSVLPFAIGMLYRQQLYRRADLLQRFAQFILFAQEEIRYSGRELDEIFSLALRRPMFACPLFEALFLECKNGGDYSKIEQISNDIRLKKSEIEMLSEFFSNLGANDVAGQLAHCGQYHRRFAQIAKEAAERARTTGRLVISLSVIAAAGMFILLI